MQCAIVLAAALSLTGSAPPDAAPPAPASAESAVQVRGAGVVNVRSGPGLSAPVLYQVRRGEVLQVLKEADGWLQVTAAGHEPGYVRSDLVERVAPAAPVTDSAEAKPPAGSPPAIEHAPLACLRPDENPQVFAGVTAAADLRRTRVYFKAHQYPDWYYVEMTSTAPPHFDAVLPQPLPGTLKIDYYLQALDANLETAQTEQYEPQVTKDGCRKKPLGVLAAAASHIVVVGTKDGQPPIPPGFSAKGIVSFVTAGGATVTGAALAGGGAGGGGPNDKGPAAASAPPPHGGGGGSGKLLLIGGLVVGGGVAVAVAAKGGGGGGATTTTTTAPPASFDLVVSKSGGGSGTVASGDGRISCGPTCSASYTAGTSVVLTATAAAGSSFDRWDGSAASCGTANQCTLTVDSAKAVTAVFDLVSAGPKKLFVQKQSQGGGTGTVTSNDGDINCGPGCTQAQHNYQDPVKVTLNATPSEGSSFAGFTGSCGTLVPVCELTMDRDQDVTATFVGPPTTFNVTVEMSGQGVGTVTSRDGKIDCGRVCSASYPAGTTLVLAASPATGSGFTLWSGDAASCKNITPCTLTVDSSKKVVAQFDPILLLA
ncbi:MAG TPA: SH3 domain-containing protein, partial [Vicinamibacteria bacterium]|nr:SH3 domain-containing protein [Vicinamibacteria bacterium]